MNRHHSMPGIFVFVLLGLFAALSTLMVLLGAQMYRSTVEHAGFSSQHRILSSYVRGMVRAQDAENAVSVAEEAGIATLQLRENFEGETYVTYLYPYEGSLRELYTEESNGFRPDWGEIICPVGDFMPVLENGLLTVSMSDQNGTDASVIVALRCQDQEVSL